MKTTALGLLINQVTPGKNDALNRDSQEESVVDHPINNMRNQIPWASFFFLK